MNNFLIGPQFINKILLSVMEGGNRNYSCQSKQIEQVNQKGTSDSLRTNKNKEFFVSIKRELSTLKTDVENMLHRQTTPSNPLCSTLLPQSVLQEESMFILNRFCSQQFPLEDKHKQSALVSKNHYQTKMRKSLELQPSQHSQLNYVSISVNKQIHIQKSLISQLKTENSTLYSDLLISKQAQEELQRRVAELEKMYSEVQKERIQAEQNQYNLQGLNQELRAENLALKEHNLYIETSIELLNQRVTCLMEEVANKSQQIQHWERKTSTTPQQSELENYQINQPQEATKSIGENHFLLQKVAELQTNVERLTVERDCLNKQVEILLEKQYDCKTNQALLELQIQELKIQKHNKNIETPQNNNSQRTKVMRRGIVSARSDTNQIQAQQSSRIHTPWGSQLSQSNVIDGPQSKYLTDLKFDVQMLKKRQESLQQIVNSKNAQIKEKDQFIQKFLISKAGKEQEISEIQYFIEKLKQYAESRQPLEA